jgi:hypothetical protein
VDRGKRIRVILLVIAAWGLAGAISARLFGQFYDFTPSPDALGGRSVLLGPMAIWLVGGLVTALALLWTNPRLSWGRALALACGWALCGPLRWEVRAALGGLITALVLRRASRRVLWTHGLVIVAGWLLAGAVSYFVLPLIPAVGFARTTLIPIAHGLLFGAVGGGVMVWVLDRVEWGGGARPDEGRQRIFGLARMLEASPLMERLVLKEVDRELYTFLGVAFALGVMTLLISMSVWSRVKATFNIQNPAIPLLVYLVTLAPTVRVPLVVAAISALLAGSDASKQQFDLLRLAPRTEREITWVYTIAPLRLTRGLLTFEYIVMLLMLSAASCAFLPSYVGASRQTTETIIVVLLMLSVSLLGMNVLAAAVGMRVALWWRDPSVATPLAPLFTLMIIIAALVVAVTGLRRMATEPSAQLVIGFFFLMLSPYLAALELVDSAQPWARPFRK